ncbi:MAG: response regulator transcription factor [Novosphingobium sp.]|nr:response regulator transcription factor [Novosphingobium sp.]MBO9601579.1 response regulator transcription factor [Novosphingobium sp.]
MLQAVSQDFDTGHARGEDHDGQAAGALDSRTRILVLDADPVFRKATSSFLAEHGFLTLEADSAGSARETLSKYGADFVVLDVKIPGEDGLAIARALSIQADICVIIVSELGSEIDRIVGLEAGADDYISKPASPRELLARIRAVRRRAGKAIQIDRPSSICYRFAGWTLDVERRVLRDAQGTITSLSEGEFSLLRTFVERPQRVLTRDQLLEYARGANCDAYDRAIDTQISRLRRKLGIGSDDLIRTIRNEGYMFIPQVTLR